MSHAPEHDQDCAGCHALMLVDRAETAEAALDRVLALCDEWDALSKGETTTTRRIREALQ